MMRIILLFLLIIGNLESRLFNYTYDLGKCVGLSGNCTIREKTATALYYNPSSITYPTEEHISEYTDLIEDIWAPRNPQRRETKSLIDLSFTIPFHAIYIEPTSNTNAVGYNNATAYYEGNVGMINIGFIYDLYDLFPFAEKYPMAFGMSFNIPSDGTSNSWNDINTQDFNFLNYGKNTKRFTFATGLSGQVWSDRLSIGASIIGSSGSNSGGFYRLREATIQSGYGNQWPNGDQLIDYSFVVAPLFGVTYRQPFLWETNLYFGLSYFNGMITNQESLSIIALDNSFVNIFSVTLNQSSFFTPKSINFSVLWETIWRMELIFDFGYYMWSHATLNPNQAVYQNKPLNYKDTMQFGVSLTKGYGVTLFNHHYPLRFYTGWRLVPAFTEDQTYEYNLLSNATHKIGGGVDIYIIPNDLIGKELVLNLSGQYHLISLRESVKSSPNPSVYYNDIDYTYGGNVFVFNFSIQFPLGYHGY